MEDLLALLLVALSAGVFLVYHLFVLQRGSTAFSLSERAELQRHLADDHTHSFHTLDPQHLHALLNGDGTRAPGIAAAAASPDNTSFVLSAYSLPVHRSLWRIVEYVLSDFIDFWWVKISDSPDFPNDLRDAFDHMLNVLAERSIRIDWTRFIVTNVISNANYLMRIYRLTEQELNSHNPFFAQTPEEARHRLIKAELLRNYKLHVAVSNPQAYLRKLSTAVLSRLLRSTDFKSETVRTLTREILTTFIFLPVMSFVQPYWLNFGIATALKGMQTAGADTEKEDAPPAPTKRHSAKAASLNTFGASLTTPANSKPSSRSSSPTRVAHTQGAEEEDALADQSLSTSAPDSRVAAASTAALSAQPPGTVVPPAPLDLSDEQLDAPPWLDSTTAPQRKDSLLTLKMKEWEGEKAKRLEKKTKSKRAQHQHHQSAQLPSSATMSGGLNASGDRHSNAQGKNAGAPSSVGHGLMRSETSLNRFGASPLGTNGVLPHDDSIPTGLMSPSGAFSHSPNHATSPAASPSSSASSLFPTLNGPNPSSQLSSHWEVRIVGAGIRFDPKPFVMYQLLVKNGLGENALKWTVVKRFAKFEELHARLKKAIPSFDAQLPKKHLFLTFTGTNLDQTFIQNRKVELQTYLGQLLWNRTVQEHPELQQFLLPTAEDAKWAQTPPSAAGAAGGAGATAGAGTGATTPGNSSNSSTPSALTAFFKKNDKDKEKEKDAVAALHAHAALQQQPPPPSPQLQGAHGTPPLIMQHTMPVGRASALHAATSEESDVFGVPSSNSFNNSTGLESPGRAGRQLPAPGDASTAAAAAALLRPNSSVSPPGTPVPKTGLPVRTYSADDSALINPFTSSNPAQAGSLQAQQSSQHPRAHGMPLHASTATGAPAVAAPVSSSGASSSTSALWEDQSLTAPLYLLVEELFNLNGRGWVRRQATWVGKQLVRMTMDDFVKAKLTKQVDNLLNEESITAQIDWITELIWPNGQLFTTKPPVTAEEKEAQKEEARRLLAHSIPTGLRTLLGREHCVSAMEKSGTRSGKQQRAKTQLGGRMCSRLARLSLCVCSNRCFEFLQMEPLQEHFVRRHALCLPA